MLAWDTEEGAEVAEVDATYSSIVAVDLQKRSRSTGFEKLVNYRSVILVRERKVSQLRRKTPDSKR